MRQIRDSLLLLFAVSAIAPATADEAVGPTAALETGVSRRHDEPLAAPFGGAPPPQSEATPTRGNPLWSIPLRALSETRERPLFSPSRRPPQPVIPAAPEPAPTPPPLAAAPAEPERPPLTLIGAIVGPSADADVALLLDTTTNVVTRARVGEDASGWRVRAVGARSIVIEKAGRTITLELPDPRDGASVAESRLSTPFAAARRTH